MAQFGVDIDVAFQGAGAKPGLEIWCVDNGRLVLVPRSSCGKFYSGNAYLILYTSLLKDGTPQHDIHYWLGSNGNELDSRLASDKALELDAALGSHAVQYQEVQGQETEKFLSYFKPCIIPVEGFFSARTQNGGSRKYEPTLFTCKGHHVAHVKEVIFARSSLNHNDVFILDTENKLFLFCGCNSSIQERAKALEVVQFLKESKHNGSCDIATIDDGKFVGDSDVGEFWSFFGGYAPIPKDVPASLQEHGNCSTVKLFWITTQGKLCQTGSDIVSKEVLHSSKCYLVDCDTQLFVWMGRNTSVTERKTSLTTVENFLRSQEKSAVTPLTFLTEGLETALFKSYFVDWPQKIETKLYSEGREKVAAIFKHQGFHVEELPDENDDAPMSMDFSGQLKVWLVGGDDTTLVTDAVIKLYTGDCYILQYIYRDNGREESIFYAWLGKQSAIEDKAFAVSRMFHMVNSAKGDPVVAKFAEGQESLEFSFILKTSIIFKGGIGKRYKEFIANKGVADETFDDSKTALFRVQGTSPYNIQAIQVDQVSNSLNSSYCYILKTQKSTFTWLGRLSSARDHDLLHRMLDMINPSWQPTLVREGNEPDEFFSALGGKAEYPTEKYFVGYREDPHLFICKSFEGDLKVKEIFNFSQDDLTTEDVFVLDCHHEIYIWIGRRSKIGSKENALNLGLKFIGMDVLDRKMTVDAPIYVVTEGCEPPIFTRFFEWDSLKANMLGNSFERKLAILKGKPEKLEAPLRSSWKAYSAEATSNSSRSVNGVKSVSPAIDSNGSASRSSEMRRVSSPAPISRNGLAGISVHDRGSGTKYQESTPQSADKLQNDHNELDPNLPVYPYERLKVMSDDPVVDMDSTRREAYLSEEEFQEKFGMSKTSFYKLPKWRRNKLKMALHLF
ncbi:hypothetical protein Leryth_009373 [Lithospermum erythrorhizon]|nr:hypothetical protein Leryth_009373 [Lithospermum erythrorhizon]